MLARLKECDRLLGVEAVRRGHDDRVDARVPTSSRHSVVVRGTANVSASLASDSGRQLAAATTSAPGELGDRPGVVRRDEPRAEYGDPDRRGTGVTP